MDITELKAIIDANIFENTSQAITGDALNDVLNLIADSLGEYVPVADIFDEAGTIRSSLLPSYVDDVLEFSTRDAFPDVGEGGKIYLAADTNLSYRWGGSEYVIIAQSLALGETSSTAYRGDRGKIAYDHSQTSHRLSIAGLEVSALGGSIDTDALASALSIPELRTAVAAHIGDGSIHITADERTAWNKIASLFGIDDEGDIYLKPDENGRARGLYSYSFLSSAGKSDTPGTGGGTVVGATVGGVDVELIDGVLKFDAYPTAASLGLGNIAFKNSLTIADVANLQSDLDGKQAVISDLATIRNNASNGATAYSWGNHASAGYALSSNLTAHTENLTIHITAAERTAWNNKYDKPASGIPYTDLADSVKSALDKAHEHANKTSVLDKLKWDEAKNAIYIGDENNRINFFVYGGVASGGFSNAGGVGSGTVTGIKIGASDIITPVNGILNIPPYPTTTSLGLKNLAFKDSLDVSEVVGLQSALSNKQDAATAITTSNYNSYSPKLDGTGASGTWGINISGNAATATNADTSNRTKFLETFLQNSTTDTYGSQYPIWAQWSNNTNVRLKCTDYTVWTDKADYAATATKASKWSTARTITLTGSVTGSVSIDGSGDVSLATTTNHTHNYAGSSSAGGSADSAITLLYNNILDTNYGNYAVFQQVHSRSDFPHSGWFNSIKMLHNNSRGYFTEIAMSFTGEDGMWRRALQGGSQAGWYKILDSGNYNSYAPKLDGTGANGTWGINISGNAATATNALQLNGHADSYFAAASSLGNYLPLTGGTLSSGAEDPLHIKGDATNALIRYYKADGTSLGYIGIHPSYGATYYDTAYRTIYHSGNCNNTSAPWSCSNLTAIGSAKFSNGAFLVKSVSSEGGIYIGATYAGNYSTGYDCIEREGAGNTLYLQYYNSGGLNVCHGGGQVTAGGNIVATGAITAGTASDSRLKSNIATLVNASSVLRQLRGVGFDWNALATDKSSYFKGHDVGLIAQEVEPLIPSAIGTIWGEYKRLDYTKITPYLVEGWKAHDDEIQRLKTKIKQLEERIYGMGR